MSIERTVRARLRRARARVRRLLRTWRTQPADAAPPPKRTGATARARFWSELRAGQREAEANAKPRS